MRFLTLALAIALVAPSPAAQSLCTTVTVTRSPTNTWAAAGNFGPAGGAGLAYVNASEPNCSWSASSGATWITFPDGASGVGSGWLKYVVAPSTVIRQAAIDVTRGAPFNVLQFSESPHGNGTLQSPVGWTASPSTAALAQPFKVSGFSIDTRAASGTGVTGVDLYWVDNTGFHSLGSATYGLPHPHVAENLGAEFLNSGYEMLVTGIPTSGTMPPGLGVSIAAFGRSSVDGTTVASGGTRVTVIDPRLTLRPGTLQFGAAAGAGAPPIVTPGQAIDISGFGWQSTWNATTSDPWIVLSATSGTGPGSVTVSVDPAQVPAAGTLFGVVRIGVPDVPGSQTDVAVRLDANAASITAPPYGAFDAPPPAGSGAVPLTGWALDDIGVASVALYRSPVAGEGGAGLVFIGNGSFTDGARPDVAAAFPAAPQKTRAGWGYMLLSNVLPGGGDGTFTFHAYAVDVEGKQAYIGSRDVALANAGADQPFGALDAPWPGEAVSGVYTFGGWVVAPHPMQITRVNMILDGQFIGVAHYGLARPDVASVFGGPVAPPDAATAGFRFTLDTRGLANGLHTIAFTAGSNAQTFNGLGSRFFTVKNP